MKNRNYPLYEVEHVNDLRGLIQNSAEKYKDKTAFKFKRKKDEYQKTYYQFYYDVKSMAEGLLSMGIRKSHIALVGENSYEWIVTYFAVVASGNVIVPLDKELGSKEIIGLIKEAGCRGFVYASKYHEIAEDSGLKISFINMEDDGHIRENGFSGFIERGRKLIEKGSKEFEKITINDDNLAAIHFTSGTTGISKGVMLTHKNIASNVIGALNNVHGYNHTVLVLPAHHTFGMTVGVLCMIHLGTCIYINNSMKRIASDFKEYEPEYLFLVPLYVEALYKRIWQTAKSEGKERTLRILCSISDALLSVGIDLRRKIFKSVLNSFGGRLKLVICGGAPLDPTYVKGFRTFGVDILNGYGITECSPIVAVNRNHYYKDGSVGTVLSCCEVKISHPDENGEGEILVKGNNVMKGYYNNEEENKKVFMDGWFNTGDIGKLDKEGFLYITGRSKNIIILNNGKNIYPEEIEMKILEIPFVKETVVYSEKDDGNSEVLLAAEVFLDEKYTGSKSKEEIERALLSDINKSLPYNKNISRIKIRETEFEKTSTRKIIRGK